MFGWSIILSTEDVDWLLADTPTRSAGHDRRLAIDTAMTIWRAAQSPPALLESIGAVAQRESATLQVFESYTLPRPQSPELVKSENELKGVQRRNVLERAAIDRSWIEFATKLRENSEDVVTFGPTTTKGADAKLHAVWDLLRMASGTGTRHAIDSVAPIVPMIGPAAAERVRLGLIAHWRQWNPWLRSGRKPDEQNRVGNLDCMGIAGITLEAIGRPDWAAQMSSKDAQRAAGYATLELNGFPKWLTDLARAKPDDVAAVLSTELAAELDRSSSAGPQFGVLQDVARGDDIVAQLMAPIAVTHLEQRDDVNSTTTSQLLEICVRGSATERARLKTLALARFSGTADPNLSSLYIGAAFQIDGKAATEALFNRLNEMSAARQAALVQYVLPRVFGDRMFWDGPPLENMTLESLERLVRLSFDVIRIEDDNVHRSGHAYSPDARDHAEHARSAVFNRLVGTPGRATFNAIMRLAATLGFPIPAEHLRKLARERAATDLEASDWKREVIAFERSAETEPQTPRALQLVALRRISDMAYDLHNDDYQQGETLSLLRGETAVQRWIADRLRLKQGRSFSVEREVHVADEKEPDLRLRAKATDASVPVEIKVAESWSVEELDDALKVQLCGRYLRQREGKQGILLLVHKKPRPRGWKAPDGTLLNFPELVSRLKGIVVEISGATTEAPQPEIAVLDASSFGTRRVPPRKSQRNVRPVRGQNEVNKLSGTKLKGTRKKRNRSKAEARKARQTRSPSN